MEISDEERFLREASSKSVPFKIQVELNGNDQPVQKTPTSNDSAAAKLSSNNDDADDEPPKPEGIDLTGDNGVVKRIMKKVLI